MTPFTFGLFSEWSIFIFRNNALKSEIVVLVDKFVKIDKYAGGINVSTGGHLFLIE